LVSSYVIYFMMLVVLEPDNVELEDVLLLMGARSSVVVKALCYRQEGCRFDTR
jgi:hypothetical protein